MAGFSTSLRNTLLIAGVAGAAASAVGARYIDLRTFKAEDGSPGITFELPPSDRHHVIFGPYSIEHRVYHEGRLVYDAACGLEVSDPNLSEVQEPHPGCIENRY